MCFWAVSVSVAVWAVAGCRTVDYSGEECDESFENICDDAKDDRDNQGVGGFRRKTIYIHTYIYV